MVGLLSGLSGTFFTIEEEAGSDAANLPHTFGGTLASVVNGQKGVNNLYLEACGIGGGLAGWQARRAPGRFTGGYQPG